VYTAGEVHDAFRLGIATIKADSRALRDVYGIELVPLDVRRYEVRPKTGKALQGIVETVFLLPLAGEYTVHWNARDGAREHRALARYYDSWVVNAPNPRRIKRDRVTGIVPTPPDYEADIDVTHWRHRELDEIIAKAEEKARLRGLG